MVSKRELRFLAAVEILFLFVFLSPFYDYFTCVEPEETTIESVLIFLGWMKKQYVCSTLASLEMVMLRNSLLQILALAIYLFRLKVYPQKCENVDSLHAQRAVDDYLSRPAGWEYLRPSVPLSKMTEEEKETEWKYSYLYMDCVYDRLNNSQKCLYPDI